MPKATYRIGVKTVIEHENKFLLLKKRTEGYWEFPGGCLEDDETIEQALRREVAEELPGATIQKAGSLLHAETLTPASDGENLCILWYGSEIELPKDISLSDEHSEYGWFTVDKVKEIASKGDRRAAELYARDLRIL